MNPWKKFVGCVCVREACVFTWKLTFTEQNGRDLSEGTEL